MSKMYIKKTFKNAKKLQKFEEKNVKMKPCKSVMQGTYKILLSQVNYSDPQVRKDKKKSMEKNYKKLKNSRKKTCFSNQLYQVANKIFIELGQLQKSPGE